MVSREEIEAHIKVLEARVKATDLYQKHHIPEVQYHIYADKILTVAQLNILYSSRESEER
jgi:hypothetical protein